MSGSSAGSGDDGVVLSVAKAPKIACGGTNRSRHPRDTLKLVEPHLARFGITRVANVTGLDRIGIPVYQAIRPGARSLSVSQGKGLDDDAAKISAIMESLECHHAEYNRCAVRLENHRHLSKHERTVAPERLPLCATSGYSPTRTLPWTQALDIMSGEMVWVPYELVHANATLPGVPGAGCFLATTNGLASGNNRAEAVLHGLCEWIERDALAVWQAAPATHRSTRLDLASVEHPGARQVLDQLHAAGIVPMAWDITSDIGIPAVMTVVFDPESDALLNPYPAAGGSGCHPDRGVALCRALTEAVQSRLTCISGARDDLRWGRYRNMQKGSALNHFRELASETGTREFSALPDVEGFQRIDEDLNLVLQRLQSIGLHEVAVVDLHDGDVDLSFVRVIVPGLEGCTESPHYTPGNRARARA